MGKTGKWLKNILTGKRDKKEKEKSSQCNEYHYNIIISPLPNENPTTPLSTPTPKEKRRWSFRRSSAAPKDAGPADPPPPPPPSAAAAAPPDAEAEHKKHAMAVAAATSAAAQAAAAVIRLRAAANGKVGPTNVEDAAAVKIQSIFRSYLARKALCALKGLVKLQALVRGHLVRKQATATLRCMQALVTAQARARAQRIRAGDLLDNHRTSTHRKSVHDNWLRNPYHEMEIGNMEENIKIVEMDINATTKATNHTKSRNSYSNSHPTNTPPERTDHKLSTTTNHHHWPPSSGGRQTNCHVSPVRSTALTEMSPRAHSGHFEDYSFYTARSSPLHHHYAPDSLSHDFPMCPSYMANTLSSRAKARSQSAPKARPTDVLERQPSSGGRRRASMEGPGRNVPPRAVRMQRSSSHAGPAAQNYQYPWSIVKLDRSTVSLKDSECGSTSTVLTNTNYCRSLVAFDIHGHRY